MTFLPFLLPLAALLAAPVAWRGLTHPETPMTHAILESLFLAVLALISWTAGFISGRGRAVIHSVAYKRGKADGYRTGRTEHEAERDRLEETIAEQRRMLAGQMRATAAPDEIDSIIPADHDHNAGLPSAWVRYPLPGGQVCAVRDLTAPLGICGMPVESEPCPDHARETRLYDHQEAGL